MVPTLVIILSVLLLIATLALIIVMIKLRQLGQRHQETARERDEARQKATTLDLSYVQQGQELDSLKGRLQPTLDAEAEAARIKAQMKAIQIEFKSRIEVERAQSLSALQAEKDRITEDIQKMQSETLRLRESHQQTIRTQGEERRKIEADLTRVRSEVGSFDDASEMASFGFYKPRYSFDSSSKYQAQLQVVRDKQKNLLKLKQAATCSQAWIVEGNAAKGRKMIGKILKLTLRAFNGECDAAIAKVKYNNVRVMESRIQKAWDAINKLVEEWHCSIASDYLNLKLQELYLVHEYQEKVQEEKEEQARIRDQMREEEAARRELERAQQEAEREETRWEEALTKARAEAEQAVGAKQQKLQSQIEDLQKRLEEARANKERAISRAQMTRSGHVYVISNVGSFGEGVYKIGMTRRLDPLDRVRELGVASVPFLFDVHAVIYSEDAPTLETKLHRIFHRQRVNAVNERREFFRVSLSQIAAAVRANHGEIEFLHDAEAPEYRKTVALRAAEADSVKS